MNSNSTLYVGFSLRLPFALFSVANTDLQLMAQREKIIRFTLNSIISCVI